MAALQFAINQTMAAVDAAIEAAQDTDHRPYLGMSGLGKSCARSIWYSFRWAAVRKISAKGIKAIQDGFAGEDLMAERLRMVPGIKLHTVNPSTGQQFGFVSNGGHVKGHMDGAVLGVLEAPKTWHVWEHKQVNETKFRALQKQVSEVGEKSALEKWDATYFAQAQLYMGNSGMTRHFLTVATPGGREFVSVRTEYQADKFEALVEKAQRVIDAPTPPERIGDATWYECKFCDFSSICHGTDAPAVNCRTCAHSTPEKSGYWSCARNRDNEVPVSFQREGCDGHRYLPQMLEHWAEWIDANETDNTVTYRLKDGRTFVNGARPAGFSSIEIQACQDKAALGVVAADPAVQGWRTAFGGEVVA